jgi:hypothetical protein
LESCKEQGRTALQIDVRNLDALVHQFEEQRVVFKKNVDFDWEDLAILLDSAGNQIEFKQV